MSDDGAEASEGWAAVGRSLLMFELQKTADSLNEAFYEAASKVNDEDQEITGADVKQLYSELEKAETFVDELAKVPSEYDRPPQLDELLDSEELQEVIERRDQS